MNFMLHDYHTVISLGTCIFAWVLAANNQDDRFEILERLTHQSILTWPCKMIKIEICPGAVVTTVLCKSLRQTNFSFFIYKVCLICLLDYIRVSKNNI